MSGEGPDAYGKIHLETQELKVLYESMRAHLSDIIEDEIMQAGMVDDTRTADKVKRLVLDQFLNRLFNSVKYSVDLDDGAIENCADPESDIVQQMKDAPETHDKVEPYDFALNDKLRNMYMQVEDKIEQVTKLRKNMPGEYYGTYEKTLHNNETWIDSQLETNKRLKEEKKSELERLKEQQLDGDAGTEEDFNQLANDYDKFLSDISGLRKDIPGTMSELANLLSVVQFLDGQKKAA